MTANQRFCLNEDRYIIDSLNPAKHAECYCAQHELTDDMHLREQVLHSRLFHLVTDLNTNQMPRLPDDREYRPSLQKNQSIAFALYYAIWASHLATLDVALSIQHRFDGELKRKKEGMQDFTSLSLFVDDVERLLHDLYGKLANEAITRVRHAVFWIVAEFAKYLRKDLWQEHQNAVDIDYMCGIGVPEGCCLSSSDYREGQCAAHDLELRARAVRGDPGAFSKYTERFVNELFANWRPLRSAR